MSDDALRRFPQGQLDPMVITLPFDGPQAPLPPAPRMGYRAIFAVDEFPDGHIGVIVETIWPEALGGGWRDV